LIAANGGNASRRGKAMALNDAAARRLSRLSDMRKWLLSQGRLPMKRRQCEALLELRHGLTRRRIREYLTTMEDAGVINIGEEEIDLGYAFKTLEEEITQ
jgi:hypothetical protein